MSYDCAMSGGELPQPAHTADPLRATLRRLPQVRRTVAAWRQLTSPAGERFAGVGAGTIVGLSGGADSSALLLALWAAGFIKSGGRAMHVVHDMRPRDLALQDQARCQSLCDRLNIPLLISEVYIARPQHLADVARGQASASRNIEAFARRERYRVLEEAARSQGIPFVAVAHHADDQIETMLMRLLRGSGPRGLSGMPTIRPLRAASRDRFAASPVSLIRPMLFAALTHDDSIEICRAAGWEWNEDHTNQDITRLRAAIRHTVLPTLKSLRPGIESSALRASELLREAANISDAATRRLLREAAVPAAQSSVGSESSVILSREKLRANGPLLIGGVLRLAASAMLQSTKPKHEGNAAMDRLTAKHLAKAVKAISDSSTQPRSFALHAGLYIEVTAHTIRIERRTSL